MKHKRRSAYSPGDYPRSIRTYRPALILIVGLGAAICIISSTAYASADSDYAAGIQYYKLRNYNAAAQYFERALSLGKATPECFLYAGHSYAGAGKRERAIVKYQEVVRLFKGQPAAALAETSMARLTPGSTRSGGSSTTTTGQTFDPSLPTHARVFYRSSGSDMIVDAKINGRPIELDFDTGAPEITVSREQLQNLGIIPPSGKPDGECGGAANSIKIPYWTMFATVQVGPIVRQNVEICVYERMETKPLLGQNFFQSFDYTIDHNAHCVEFKRKGMMTASARASGGYNVPFTFRESGSRIVVDVEVNGRKGAMMLDTGNESAGISFDTTRQMKSFGVSLPEDARLSTARGVSGVGSVYRFTLPRVRLGPIEKSNVSAEVNVEVSDADEELPLVGQAMLEGWQYTIDMERKQLHFVRR